MYEKANLRLFGGRKILLPPGFIKTATVSEQI